MGTMSMMELLREKRMRSRNLELVVQVLALRVHTPHLFEERIDALLGDDSGERRDTGNDRVARDDNGWMKQFVVRVKQMDDTTAAEELRSSEFELQQRQQK